MIVEERKSHITDDNIKTAVMGVFHYLGVHYRELVNKEAIVSLTMPRLMPGLTFLIPTQKRVRKFITENSKAVKPKGYLFITKGSKVRLRKRLHKKPL